MALLRIIGDIQDSMKYKLAVLNEENSNSIRIQSKLQEICNCDITGFSSANELMRCLEYQHFDCLIVDILADNPHTGLKLIAVLQLAWESTNAPTIPICVLSKSTDKKIIQRAMSLSAIACLNTDRVIEQGNLLSHALKRILNFQPARLAS